MTHEDFERPEEIKGSSDRTFGWIIAGFFVIVACLPLIRPEPTVRWWAVVLALIFFILAIVRPTSLALLNRLWLRFGLLLHKIVNPAVLALMFYGVMTPIGILMRPFGYDPLKLKPSPQSPTYWNRRSPPGPSAESMKNQF